MKELPSTETRAAQLAALSNAVALDPDTISRVLVGLQELAPRWRFVGGPFGGALVLGPEGFELGRVWYELAMPREARWRWRVGSLVADRDHAGGEPDAATAVSMVSTNLSSLAHKRAWRCPGCSSARPDAAACGRDVLVVPGVTLSVACLLAPGHDGDHEPICPACFQVACDAYGPPATWARSRGKLPAALVEDEGGCEDA